MPYSSQPRTGSIARSKTVRALHGTSAKKVIVVRAQNSPEAETAYLLGSAANAAHLRRALAQMEAGEVHEQ